MGDACRLAVAALALLVGCVASAGAAPLPVRELFKPPLFRTYSLSPDGRYLVEIAIADRADADRVEKVRSSADLQQLQQADQRILLTDLTTMKYIDLSVARAGRHTSGVMWLDGKTFLWHVRDRRRGEMSIEVLETGEDQNHDLGISAQRVLGKDAWTIDAQPTTPWQLLVAQPDAQGESVYRIDARRPLYVQTTAANRVAGPFREVQGWGADPSGAVRAVALERAADRLRILVRPSGTDAWQPGITLPNDDSDQTELVGMDPTGQKLLVITDHGSDKQVLRELDPVTGALGRIVIGDARNDVTRAYVDPRDGRVIGALINDNENRIRFIDPEIEKLQAEAARLLPRANPRVVNFSADRRHAIVFTGQSDDPGRYYYLSLVQRKALLIETAAPWLDGMRFSRSEPIELKARDGLVIYGQFTRPSGVVGKPPLVLMPHGGPHGVRDSLTYDPEVQFLTSRGYAVLQVDFRGSGGYGREYMQAGYRRWGAEMQLDLLDALDSVVARGWVDPDRVCAFGGSYGGYAAMMTVIQAPERFRCAVTYAGVSDLTLLFRSEELRSSSFYQQKVFDFLRRAIGDPKLERAELQARSPAFTARGIKRPVFIAHGDADKRAEPEHAWRLRAAIEAGGGKPEWLMAKGEGHGFRLAENIEAFHAQLEAFLARNLAVAPPPGG